MTGEFNLVPDQLMTADHPAPMAEKMTSPSLERNVLYEEDANLITENSNLQAVLRIHLILIRCDVRIRPGVK